MEIDGSRFTHMDALSMRVTGWLDLAVFDLKLYVNAHYIIAPADT
jgi:hypothetical protein